jgi:hypothetical protein
MIQQATSNPRLVDEQVFSERIASAISAIGPSRHIASPRDLGRFRVEADINSSAEFDDPVEKDP